ncbi:major histocompatibility complex class I-related gene protein-like [Cololabis saira]|uniref:major histocompatibility complex class I-related gene protein-like n=1 Tax=Cololabis saira TaxID=129043 RepID=UPI002AD48A7E|nr:major histocompatibility complex class I-related gene protein-like [Cololabis saira]
MIGLLLLLLSGVDPTAGVTHSLKYFYTGSSGIPNFPEFVVVGLVDDVQMFRYDSNTKKAEPKQDWMSRVTEDDPTYWMSETGACVGKQKSFRDSIEIAKQRFNQSGGVHILQSMYGCEWDDETGDVQGHYQDGYDGEEFLVLDQKMESWIAPKQEAVITRLKWDHDRYLMQMQKNYFTQICPEWGKKYVNYGRSSLMRTERLSVSLLQKTSSSPVSCHATGFYPNRAEMFWRKDGEEIHEGVDKGEILPNHDGTFQMTVHLRLPSDSSEDWTKYECVFQLSGDNNDIVNELDKGRVRSNGPKPNDMIIPIFVTLVALAAAAVVVAVVVGVVLLYKKEILPYKNNKNRSPSPDSQDSMKQMLPKTE